MGDQLSFTIILDNNLVENGGFENFQSHFGIHDTGNPFNIRYVVDLPDVTVGNIASRFEKEVLVI